MKKILGILFFFHAIAFSSFSQARYWVGVSGGNWSTAANWSLTSGGAGGAGAPTSVQDAIINTSIVINIDVNVGVNSITVTNNSTVTFQTAVTRTITPTSTSLVNKGFRLDAGSTLTLDCTNASGTNNLLLDLANGIGVTGQIDGTLIFSGTGGSISSNARFTTFSGALSYGNVTVSNTGYIRFLANTGNAITSGTSFTMQNSATYEIAKNGGSFPTGIWQTNSLALATGTGINGPLFLGTTYGNLQINCPGITTPIYFNANISFNNVDIINTGADVVRAKTGTSATTFTTTINGNLSVSASSILETSGNTTTSGNPGIIIVKGSVINNGIIRENGTVTGNQFILQGTSNQNISGTGSYGGDDFDFILNNTAGATLLAGITLPYRYSINAGNLTLGNFNISTPAINQVGAATATANHVITNGTGKLVIQNIGAGTVVFPIGASATTINPLAIFNGGGFNFAVRVEIGINPPIGVPSRAVNRTWFVTPNGTPGAVNTNFYYAAGEGNAGFNYASSLELGHYTAAWNVIQTGLTPIGNYQIATTISTLGNNIEAPLVLANIGAILAADNPVSVNYFTGTKQNGNHLLNWKLTCNSTPAVTMVMQRSTDGVNYTAVFSEYATALRCLQPFYFTDNQPASGVNYYRIKMIDANGKVTYSSIISLINAVKGIELMSISPNPVVNKKFKLEISTAQNVVFEMLITDLQGRVVQKKSFELVAGFNTIPVLVNNLAAGTYQVYGNTVQGRTRLLRFIVQ